MLCRSHNLLTIPLRAPVRHTAVDPTGAQRCGAQGSRSPGHRPSSTPRQRLGYEGDRHGTGIRMVENALTKVT
jgi:hypothetical protein